MERQGVYIKSFHSPSPSLYEKYLLFYIKLRRANIFVQGSFPEFGKLNAYLDEKYQKENKKHLPVDLPYFILIHQKSSPLAPPPPVGVGGFKF